MITARDMSHLTSGIGLRAPHIPHVLQRRPDVGFLEVHTENYFGGGVKLKRLQALAEHYRLSFHGVGLSPGRADELEPDHLRRVAHLCRQFEPWLVSEHLSFSAIGGVHVPDLLPIPLTEAMLARVCAHVARIQDTLQRQILIENPSAYVAFEAEMSEAAFLSQLSRATGCGLLIDLNNIHVQAHNFGFEALSWFDDLSAVEAVGEYHLAGHQVCDDQLIDTHGERVSEPVWALYRHALSLTGDRPTLIEWDTDLPELEVLLAEAHQADSVRARAREVACV